MPDDADFTTAGKLLERNRADTVPVSCAQIVSAEINDAIVADIDAMMREARASHHQVIAVSELALIRHASSSADIGISMG